MGRDGRDPVVFSTCLRHHMSVGGELLQRTDPAPEWRGSRAIRSADMFKKKRSQLNTTDEQLTERSEDQLEEYSPDYKLDEFYEDGDDEYEMRDYHPIRFRRDGKSGLMGGIMYAVFIISVSAILACIGWLFASDVLALNKEELTAVVVIPPYESDETQEGQEGGSSKAAELVSGLIDSVKNRGDDDSADDAEADDPYSGDPNVDIDRVAGALKDAGLIEYEFLFKLYSKLSHADYKIEPGTYELSTKFDYRALVKKMQIGSESQVSTKITFPEGFTSEDIFARLAANNICSVEDLREAAANYNYSYTFLEGIEKGDSSRLEGYLFPDTYEFYEGMQASSALNKFLRNFHYKITAEMYDKAENMGYTFNECIIVASMIEKEAANDEERAKIASVIYNRLAAGMPLQIDATSLYSHPEHDGAPTQEMLDDASDPYNTRLNYGLPPTPISNPGKASINAAFGPADTNYYYYALDTSTNTHRFFTNAYEFEAFIATQNYS